MFSFFSMFFGFRSYSLTLNFEKLGALLPQRLLPLTLWFWQGGKSGLAHRRKIGKFTSGYKSSRQYLQQYRIYSNKLLTKSKETNKIPSEEDQRLRTKKQDNQMQCCYKYLYCVASLAEYFQCSYTSLYMRSPA